MNPTEARLALSRTAVRTAFQLQRRISRRSWTAGNQDKAKSPLRVRKKINQHLFVFEDDERHLLLAHTPICVRRIGSLGSTSSHADFTYTEKYGIRDSRGSGRASARETLARVAAGAIAKKFLKEKLGVEILSYVEQVGTLKAKVDMSAVTPEDIEANIIRCPDQKMAEKMIELVDGIRKEGDSVGGVIRGLIKHVPKGLGEPVFDKLSADLGKAMLSINAVKGFDIGSGFECVAMRGSEHNDPFTIDAKGEVRTTTNHAGGTLGGISNGEDIYFRVAFKPVSTIRKKQHTVNTNTHKEIELEATGRHDPCVLPRAVPIVDAMSALVIMDHYLRNRAQNSG